MVLFIASRIEENIHKTPCEVKRVVCACAVKSRCCLDVLEMRDGVLYLILEHK